MNKEGGNMLKGIDVSSHNGEINWQLVKPQIDFAIIRLGYGDNVESQDDRCFHRNIKGCIDNNIPFGVYIYSYAKNLTGSESIQSEIEHTKRLLSQIERKPFCVYIDMEDDSTIYLKKLMLTNFALEYCKQITQAGYKAGVYANENWFKNYLNCSTIASYGYSIWCAKYSSYKPVISSNYDIWQYSDSGHINGINTNVDMNYMYRDIRDIKPYNPIQTNNEVNVYYRVKTQKHGWLSEVKNLEDYAGWQDSPIVGVAIKVSKGSIKYRVHIKNGNWLSYVTDYNINDIKKGWAGNNKIIDAIECYYYTPSDIRPYKKAKYKVNNYSWQYDNEKKNGQDGYAGKFGVNATKFQIIIE
jgi:GH25 family lysozyme M1 (1,4-beta-N-acetylmuramidase)